MAAAAKRIRQEIKTLQQQEGFLFVALISSLVDCRIAKKTEFERKEVFQQVPLQFENLAMNFRAELNIPVHEVNDPLLAEYDVRLFVKRLDLISEKIKGNKYFKLKYTLEEVKRLGHDTILTFGGAYSNHLMATSIAGKEVGIKTIGIVRGEEVRELNPHLQLEWDNGMQFEFVSRERYRQKESEEFISGLKEKYGRFYLIPEGGSNTLAVKGCEEILNQHDPDVSTVFCCVGTGGTAAGLIRSIKNNQRLTGIPVLKGAEFLEHKIEELSGNKSQQWNLNYDYHFGGYAKSTPELISFMDRFSKQAGIPTEHVYTAKMFYAVYDLASKGFFQPGSSIMAIHTGGI